MTYKVELTKVAEKFIKKQDRTRRQQIKRIIESLSEDPFKVKNVKTLQGIGDNVYRIRFGNFRVLFQVKSRDLIILIIKIGPRGDIYNK